MLLTVRLDRSNHPCTVGNSYSTAQKLLSKSELPIKFQSYTLGIRLCSLTAE